MWICQQDSPAAVSEEELARHLHVKELDERPCMFQAGSAFDGWAEHFHVIFKFIYQLTHLFYKMDIEDIIKLATLSISCVI